MCSIKLNESKAYILSEKEEKEIQNALIDIIRGYLDTNVTKPTIETLEKDLFVIHKLGTLLISLRLASELINEKGIEFDRDYLQQLPRDEIEKRIDIYENFISSESSNPEEINKEAHELLRNDSSKKHLLAYLLREINWVTISILSASYISAHVLLRSSFELLIGIATNEKGKMGERIESIKFLSTDEQQIVKKLWRKLCGWGHPYEKWEKEICPIYVAHEPLYHPRLCKECIEKFEILLGLFLVVALEKFEINKADLTKIIHKYQIDFSKFPILNNRI